LQEDYNPDTGKVIVGLARSHHYNHSGYDDLIITGLAGLRPRADDVLEVNPLIPTGPRAANPIQYFCLENVPYHGQSVTILYDRDGKRYHKGTGLSVYVNGRQVVSPSALGRKTVTIPPPVIAQIARPIDLAVNLTQKGYPMPDASANATPADLFQAIDGRVWFWPNVRNYWSNAGSKADSDWYSLDFGAGKSVSAVKLSFYGDETQFQAPTRYAIQYWTGTDWAAVANSQKTPAMPLANGENTVTFSSVTTSKLRVVFLNPKAAAVALVELKVF
jgi:hypothetical protein